MTVLDSHEDVREFVISLSAEEAIFASLSTTLQSLSARLRALHSSFLGTLERLSRSISDCALPVSSTSAGFRPYSLSDTKTTTIRIPYQVFTAHKSDLSTWREVFGVYLESQVFENIHEPNREIRSVEDAEKRLRTFVERLNSGGLLSGRKLKLKQSRKALQIFLRLNIYILDVKKVVFQLHRLTALVWSLICPSFSSRTSKPRRRFLGQCLAECRWFRPTHSRVMAP
jgi:hypothetical protein